jgi:hypothetical protein
LTTEDIFRVLQRQFHPPDRLLDGIDIPPDWKLDRDALLTIVRISSFLFPLGVFDRFFSCQSVHEIVPFLAFEYFGQYPERQRQFIVDAETVANVGIGNGLA